MEISVSISEALRYAGKKSTSECDGRTLLSFERFAKEVVQDSRPSYSARIFDIEIGDNSVKLKGTQMSLESSSLASHLSLCKKAIIFSATLGIEVDRKTARLAVSSMEDALIYDACATALIEDYCDKICEKEKEKEKEKGGSIKLTSRFSPGYSDLSISSQIVFLSLTDASRKAGINMNPSFLLSPMKSVTAIAGIIESEKQQ